MTTPPAQWLYPSDLAAATAVQKELAQRVVTTDAWTNLRVIAGLDVSNNIAHPEEIYTAVVALERHTLKTVATSTAAYLQQFPYITGFLGFREAPGLISAIRGLPHMPDVLMVDGHGISHPRGLGIASHIGVLLDIPTIGVAKTILVGKPAAPLGPHVGDQVPLIWKGQQLAVLLRTKPRCNPLIISCGHRVTLATAIELVLECLRGYRLPEPTRQAHLTANACRQQGCAAPTLLKPS